VARGDFGDGEGGWLLRGLLLHAEGDGRPMLFRVGRRMTGGGIYGLEAGLSA
jgi:hypothetical protein